MTAGGPAEQQGPHTGRGEAGSTAAQDAAASRVAAHRRTTHARGLLLGLLLGESLAVAATTTAATGPVPGTAAAASSPTGHTSPLRCGVGSQLACFTVEGLTRAALRHAHRGIAHVPSLVWEAYGRWASAQGLLPAPARPATAPGRDRPGWLAGVPALGERRGSAPATVSALQAGRMGTRDEPVTDSAGAHALVRTLPLAVLGTGDRPATAGAALHGLGGELGALTHGHPDGYGAAADAVVLAAALAEEGLRLRPGPASHRARTGEPGRAVTEALDVLAAAGVDPSRRQLLSAAVAGADERPGDPAVLSRCAPDRRAPGCLAGALYAVLSHPVPDRVGEAVALAARAPDGPSTAAATGGLLGALHGADALPVGPVSRLELAWVADTLARDLVLQLTEAPGGDAYTPAWDPSWWDRYGAG